MSAIQGFPSNQKVPLGTGITNNFTTVIPTDPNRAALDVPRFAFRVNDALNPRTAGPTTGIEIVDGVKLFWVDDTATPARVGDFVRFEDGPAAFLEIPIVKVETNRFLLAVNSGILPVATNKFFIMRYATQRVSEDGSQLVTIVPVSYVPVRGGSINTTTTPINDAAYVELIASTPDAIYELEVFNKTQISMILAIGAPGSEQDICFIGSDGLERQQIPIPAGSRVSLKAVGGVADMGWILLNAFG